MSFPSLPTSPAPQGLRPHPPLRLPRQPKARCSAAAVLRRSPSTSTASRTGTLDRINHPAFMALSQVRWTHGRCGTIHRGATPTPFSTTPGQGCMNSLAHNRTRYVFRASRRSLSPFHPDIFFHPCLGPLPPSTRLCTGAPAATRAALTTPVNFYTPPRSIQFA